MVSRLGYHSIPSVPELNYSPSITASNWEISA